MRQTCLTLLSGAMLLAVGVCSCTKDDAYNQLTESDGIDLTINIAPNGLTLPLGSVDRIMLTEIMDTAATQILKIDPVLNRFYIEETGSLEATNISSEDIRLGYSPTLSAKDFALDIEHDWDPIMQAVIDNTQPGTPLDNLFSDSRTVVATRDTMNVGDTKQDATSFILRHEDTDKAIISISSIEFKNNAAVDLNLQISKLPGEMQEYDLQIDSVRLTVPNYIVLVGESGEALEMEASGKYILPSTSVHKNASSTTTLWKMAKVQLHAIDFKDDKLVNNDGVIERDGEIQFGGKITINDLKVEAKDLMVVGKRKGSEHNTVIMKEQIHVEPFVYIDSIDVKSVKGVFNPEIEDMKATASIDLDSKLDFLTDLRTSFDPEEVSIGVDLTYNCPLEALGQVTLRNEYDEKTTVEDIRIYQPADGSKLHLDISTKDPAGKADTYQFKGSIGEVLSPIPSKVYMDMGIDIVKEETEIIIGKNYNVYARYDIYVPLSFTAIHSTYEEVVEDVFKDIEESISAIDEVSLTLTCISSLDVDATVNVMGRGASGVNDPSLVVCNNNGVIKRGTVNNPTTSEFTISLSIKDISAVKDLALQLNVTGENCSLQPDQYLEVSSMKLSFKNLNINLNDKD